MQVIPVQEDEFTCMSCFLVHHRTQLAREKSGDKYCVECEDLYRPPDKWIARTFDTSTDPRTNNPSHRESSGAISTSLAQAVPG